MVKDIWKVQLQIVLVVPIQEGLLDIGSIAGICVHAQGRLATVNEGTVVDFGDEVPQLFHVSAHLFFGDILL